MAQACSEKHRRKEALLWALTGSAEAAEPSGGWNGLNRGPRGGSTLTWGAQLCSGLPLGDSS